jgi:ribosome-binding factor A
MSSHRSLRIAEAIREVVASAILFEVSDPRIRSVTVLRVEVSQDLRNATVFVSVMGTEAERNLAMKGLRHASGFLQSRVAARLQMRFTPMLAFKLDDGVQKSVEIGRLIDEAVASDRKPRGAPAQAEAGSDPDDEDLDDDPDDEDFDDDPDDEDLDDPNDEDLDDDPNGDDPDDASGRPPRANP